MRILDISPLFPYPPVDGGRRGIYNPLRFIARRGHSIHLACLSEQDSPDLVRELEKDFTVDVVLNRAAPTRIGALASIGRQTPYQISRFHNPELLRRVRQMFRTSSFDILQVEGIQAAHYALVLGNEFNIPTVMRVHDMLSVNMSRKIEHTGDPLMKLWLNFDVRRLRAYEKACYAGIGSNLMISEVERDIVRGAAPGARCDLVPAGVDLDEFAPLAREEDPGSVLWMGALHWAPNRNSFWWFYNEIVPEIVRRYPDVRIRVAGTATPPEILGIRHPNVEILGFVPDIRTVMAASRVCVVPLQVGSGVRIKLLEMFAMQRAVVATTVGAEGLNVVDGEQALIADSPGVFADRVVQLLGDGALREALGRRARAHVEKFYSWGEIAGKYESVYRSLLKN